MENHYKPLGCHRGSTDEEIRAAWKLISRATHPDHASADDQASKTTDFAELSASWAVLKDPKRRAKYEAALLIGNKPCSECSGLGFRLKRLGYSKTTKETCSTCCGAGRVPYQRS